MLINFTVGNYRSFKEKKTLSMEATAIKELKESVIEENKYRLLPSAVIYGANSSGKSNLLKAIATMKGVVLSSVRLNPGETLDYDPFALSMENIACPTFFEMEFFLSSVNYRYGFEYDESKILSEWCYEKCEGEKEYNLFVRKGGGIGVSKKRFPEGLGKEMSTADNRLFLSLVAQLNGEKAQRIISWFHNCNLISGIESGGYEGFTIKMLFEKLKGYDSALEFFQKLQLGFENIDVLESEFSEAMLPSRMPETISMQMKKTLEGRKMLSVMTKHKIYDEAGEVVSVLPFNKDKMESEGSKKIIDLSGPIFDSLLTGKVLIVDELDAKLHSILTRQIIKLFRDRESNPNNAQLIFATHDTNLLNVKTFRRDQVWFTEKDSCEGTDLYSLAEFREPDGTKIRKDRSLESDYINGRYGAIPYIKG
jgi:Predicted ATPases